MELFVNRFDQRPLFYRTERRKNLGFMPMFRAKKEERQKFAGRFSELAYMAKFLVRRLLTE
jgi:hypothetical protein